MKNGDKAICQHCKKIFIYQYRSSMKYCSNECAVAEQKLRDKLVYESRRKPKSKEKRRTPMKNVPSITEIQRLAREKGMSYGKYVLAYMS